MNTAELEKYFKEHKQATVAEIQQYFSLKYSQVRRMFHALEVVGLIRLDGELIYKWVGKNEVKQVEQTKSDDEKKLYDFFADSDDDDDEEIDSFEALFGNDDEESDEKDNGDKDSVTTATDSATSVDVAEAIKNKLNVFNIKVDIAEVLKGASVTRYVFNVLSPQTRMSDFQRYADDIRACAESYSSVRIIAPIRGTRQVAVEVANKIRNIVNLDDVLNCDEFSKSNGQLDFVIGTNVSNKNIVVDLARLPHLLVAGTIGSGKTVVLTNLIISLMQKYSPDHVRLLLVDPKYVEFSVFNGAPHMLTQEAITSDKDALAAMDYLIEEMNRRYTLFKETRTANIEDYKQKTGAKLPYWVFVVDEIAELMSLNKIEFEKRLLNLTQKSRAVGIHVVLATQRPDVKVITGVVKASIPARIALKMVSSFDSITVLGAADAEKLIGRGDLLLCGESAETERVQAAYLCADDVRKTVERFKTTYASTFDEKLTGRISVSANEAKNTLIFQQSNVMEIDPLCKEALRHWLEKQNGRASVASIQRNLGIGFNRAGRILETLQKLGYVEEHLPDDPLSKPLRVLVSLADLDWLFPAD